MMKSRSLICYVIFSLTLLAAILFWRIANFMSFRLKGFNVVVSSLDELPKFGNQFAGITNKNDIYVRFDPFHEIVQAEFQSDSNMFFQIATNFNNAIIFYPNEESRECSRLSRKYWNHEPQVQLFIAPSKLGGRTYVEACFLPNFPRNDKGTVELLCY